MAGASGPFRSGASCRPRNSISSSCPTFSASASSCAIDRRLLPRAGHHPYQLADGAGALQGFHLHAQDQRLSLHPHHGDRAGKAAGGNPDPHPGNARHRRARRRRPLALSRACARPRATTTAHLWLAARHGRSAGARRQRRGGAGEFRASPCTRTRSSASRPRAPDLPAARRHADRFRLCRAYRSGQHRGRAPRSMATMCRCTRRCNNGDQVEIITTKDSTPSPLWEQFVVTGRARAEIRRFLRHAQRDEHVKLRAARSWKRPSPTRARELTDKAIGEVAKKLRLSKAEDVYADVGRGALRGHEVLAGGIPRTQARRQGAHQQGGPPAARPSRSPFAA